MPSQARIGDLWTGICCCHSDPTCIDMQGIIVSSSGNHVSGILGVARLTDIVMGNCGHYGTIVTGSGKSFTNNLGKARVGDQVSGCTIGQIVTGNGSHQTG